MRDQRGRQPASLHWEHPPAGGVGSVRLRRLRGPRSLRLSNVRNRDKSMAPGVCRSIFWPSRQHPVMSSSPARLPVRRCSDGDSSWVSTIIMIVRSTRRTLVICHHGRHQSVAADLVKSSPTPATFWSSWGKYRFVQSLMLLHVVFERRGTEMHHLLVSWTPNGLAESKWHGRRWRRSGLLTAERRFAPPPMRRRH